MNTNSNNTINIQLLNHKDTDYSHLTPKDYLMCINNCNYCVKTLIEKVHFNPDKPENMNIFLSNIKGKYIMIYKDNEWQIQDKKEKIDDLYDSNDLGFDVVCDFVALGAILLEFGDVCDFCDFGDLGSNLIVILVISVIWGRI